MLKITKNLIGTLIIAAAVSSGIGSTGVQAQEKVPTASIAVVDVTRILIESNTWKNAKKEMEGSISAVQQDINVKRDALKVQAEELKRQQTILAPDVFQQKAKEIQRQQRTLQREAQDSNSKINDVLNQVRGRLRGVIVKLAATVASERKMNIGFDRSNVIFFDNGMDITDEVLKRFDASKTKVEITVGKDKKQ